MDTLQQVKADFEARFGEPPRFVVRAPGRVNLIGEHTDYNDGFVFPMAIERAVYIALRPRDDGRVSFYSSDFDATYSYALDDFDHADMSPAEYAKGMTRALQNAGHALVGWEGVLAGDVPVGAGLSSSAAMEMAVGQAFAAVGGFTVDGKALAQMGQWVENVWLGLGSGIMDQMISANGQADRALMIDCRTLDTEQVPIPDGYVVVILDTGTRRGLVDSEYNTRRQQCEQAAAFYHVPKLRDLDLATFNARADALDELPRLRARHVVTENDRVLAARDALNAGDAETFGQLMNASHISMRDDFDISSPALNAMVEQAQSHSACVGARMTGGGFAGCAVALVRAAQADEFAVQVAAGYLAETGHTPQVYITQATDGVALVD